MRWLPNAMTNSHVCLLVQESKVCVGGGEMAQLMDMSSKVARAVEAWRSRKVTSQQAAAAVLLPCSTLNACWGARRCALYPPLPPLLSSRQDWMPLRGCELAGCCAAVLDMFRPAAGLGSAD
jgi:hypothetical protein